MGRRDFLTDFIDPMGRQTAITWLWRPFLVPSRTRRTK